MNMDSCSCNCDCLARILKVACEESRLKILNILQEGERCVCEIEKQIDLSQSLISHHLKDLKDEGIVADKKQGLRVYYSLTEKGKKITDLLFKIKT